LSFAPFFLARITNPATGTPASIRNSASAISNAARRAFLFRHTYWAICDEAIDRWIDALDLCAAESGFSWYSVSKLEHQLVSSAIR
jgi:hypothetical protein